MGATRLGGLTLAEMLWYLTITEAIMLSAPRLAQQVDEDVRTGALAVKLTRPISYPLYFLSASLGERFVRFAVNLAVGAAITTLFVGPPPSNAVSLVAFAVTLPLAFVLDATGNILIGIGAFWLEDTSGLTLIYSRLTMILGGMLIPIDLFPAWLKALVAWLPFSGIVYGPAHLFVHVESGDFVSTIVKQVAGTAVLGLVVWLVYARALDRISAHGG